ncbi:MAG: aminotransferase, partial [Gemmatimonadota bacterium]
MPTRRRFLGSLFASTTALPTLAALKSDALARILPAARSIDGRDPADVAQDEDFWREIQQAFDIDRGMINLNNGGVAPSPRVVNAAFQR